MIFGKVPGNPRKNSSGFWKIFGREIAGKLARFLCHIPVRSRENSSAFREVFRESPRKVSEFNHMINTRFSTTFLYRVPVKYIKKNLESNIKYNT